MKYSYSLEFILKTIGENIRVEGDFKEKINGISSLSDAVEGDLFFYLDKYKHDLTKTNASLVLVPISPSACLEKVRHFYM